MDYKKLLFCTISAIWELLVLVQQVYWIMDENYSFIAFIWGLIEIWFPYLIYKAITKN